MKCPDDGATISTKHFDAEWGLYECPKCGNLYTADELEEANNGTSPRKRAEAEKRIGPVAKGKKRLAAIEEDEAELERHNERILGNVVKQESRSRHRDEMSTTQIVNVWADEIQAVYHDLGGSLDEINAQDKALTLWREIQTQTNISVREQEVPHSMCKEHAA